MAGYGNGIMRGASGGISRLAAALGGGDLAEQQAQQQAMEQQSKIGLALSQIRAHDAQAGLEGAKTDALRSRPQIMRDLIAANSGVDGPSVDAFQQKLRTGELVTDFQPQEASRITQALTRFAPLASNTGDIKADDWAKALGGFRNMDLGDQVLSGQRTPGAVAASQAAVEGKPLYHADSTGAVLDLYGGKLDTNNPMAGSAIRLRTEQAGAQKANAAQSYAAAGASNAHAGLFRAQTDNEKNGGGGKAPAGYEWGPPDPSTGQRTLTAIPGGPAVKEPSEGERKAGSLLMRLRGSMQQLNDAVSMAPGAAKPATMAEAVKRIPLAGDSVANSWFTPEARQRVENAQLDMLDAALTLGTGAAYTREQLVGYSKSYFPQIGDDKKTVADKQVRLANVIRAAEIAAGRAADRAIPVVPKQPGPGQPLPRDGGATGTWDDPAGGAWKIERVN